MALKKLRRIDVAAGETLFDEISSHVLSTAWSRGEIEQAVRTHPDLIVRRGDNVLLAIESGGLAYGFESQSAFIDEFAGMFQELLPRVRRETDVDSVRFRLTHNPARPIVEPVLRNLWFMPLRSWLGFSLSKKTALPRIVAVKGVTFRDGGMDDLDEMVRIDRECFPDTPLPAPAVRRAIERGDRVIVADSDGRVAGYVFYRRTADEEGYIWVLAVGRDARGRGIGAALTVRAAKRLFGEGVDHVDLKTEDNNSDAIRLYRRLGFRQTTAGRDYSRPTDPRAISRIKRSSEGTLIRFGGWR
jgi:[ribosomal protein S18]-alanine N-acetyltransferase